MVITRERQSGERRALLLQRALELFLAEGYASVSVRDIIARSGVGTGTFYNYFDGKEQILQALLDDFADRIIGSIGEYYRHEADLRERFVETKRLTMELFARNRALSEVYSRVAGTSDAIDECLRRFEDRLIDFYSRNIEYGIANGVFAAVEVRPVAHAILAVEKHALYRWTVSKTITEEEMIADVVSFHQSLAAGLLVRTQGHSAHLPTPLGNPPAGVRPPARRAGPLAEGSDTNNTDDTERATHGEGTES